MTGAALPAFLSPTATASNGLSKSIAATLAALAIATPASAPSSTPTSLTALPPSHHFTIRKPTSRSRLPTAFNLSLPKRFRRQQKTPEQLQAERHRRRLLNEAWGVLRERFVDEGSINWTRLQFRLESRKLDTDQDLQTSLQWLFSHAHDPFTRYLSADQLDSVKNDIDGEMCGVGIVFYAENQGWRRTRRVVIKNVVRKSPAADAGLLIGDEITAIDMVDVRRMTFDEATQRLLGKEGKKVLISFSRDAPNGNENGVELNVLLTRRRFSVPTVTSEILEAPGVGAIGYLQVREFTANTASQTRKAVREMTERQAKVFVLDMRGNPGGLVDKAVEVAKEFLDRDRIVVRFVGRHGAKTMERSGWRFFWRRHGHVTKEPMIVIVDSETASASELVAAALRDNCRAVVVGNSTFGKGSVQAIVQLSDGAGAAVTVARYRTPRDKSIEMGRGLRPDLVKRNLSEDGAGVVHELFGRAGAKRMRWVVSRLDKCVAPGCVQGKKGRMGDARAGAKARGEGGEAGAVSKTGGKR